MSDILVSQLPQPVSGDINLDNTEIVANVNGVTKKVPLQQAKDVMWPDMVVGPEGPQGPPGPPGQDATLPHIINGYQIQSFNENTFAVTAAGNVTLNFNDSGIQVLTLASSATITGFTNIPTSANTAVSLSVYVINTGNYTLSYPANVMWSGAEPPVITPSGKDVLLFTTYDQGTTFYGFIAGQDFR